MNSTNLALASTIFQSAGLLGQGIAAKASGDYQAAQLEQRAGQMRAAGQHDATEQRRRARLVQSALQARAGGGGLDPTVVQLSKDIAAEGEYRALSSLYEAEDTARGDEMAAAGARMQGKNKRLAGGIGAVSTLFSPEAQTLFTKYGVS